MSISDGVCGSNRLGFAIVFRSRIGFEELLYPTRVRFFILL